MCRVLIFSLVLVTLGLRANQINAQELTPAIPGQFPYHASIQWFNDFWGFKMHYFSGVILDERHILTIGNLYWPVEELSVLVGTIDIMLPTDGQWRDIKNITWHPNYFLFRQDSNQDIPPRNDLAIIELVEPIEFDDNTMPITLPNANRTVDFSEGTVTDWPFSGIDGSLSYVTMPVISNDVCSRFYGKYKITDGNFCGALIDGEDAIDIAPGFGDGSVMACQDAEGEEPYLCGLKSLTPIYNVLCDGPESGAGTLGVGYPTAFTKISLHVDWINEVIQKRN